MRGFNLSRWALEHIALTRYLIGALLIGGILSYGSLGQDEDPPFTFRQTGGSLCWVGTAAGPVGGDELSLDVEVGEGARLELELVHVEARCRACGEIYRPEHHVLLCPRCGALDGEALGEAGLWLESIELADGGPGP